MRFWFTSKRNERVVILFWRISTSSHPVYFSPAARGEPVCRRLSRDVCGDLVSLQGQRKGSNFVLASFRRRYTMYIFPGCAGGTGSLAGLKRRLRRFGSPSSGTGRWGFCFGVFPTILYLVYFSPAARGEPVCRRVSRDVCGDFGSPPSGMGGW